MKDKFSFKCKGIDVKAKMKLDQEEKFKDTDMKTKIKQVHGEKAKKQEERTLQTGAQRSDNQTM